MKHQRRKMLVRDFGKDNRMDAKQFKRPSGSPILYKKARRHRALYYPQMKYHTLQTHRSDHSHKHAVVVYSQTYGREVYANIDIWPDETAREKLIEKLKGLSFSQEDDVGIDIRNEEQPAEDEGTESAEDALLAKPDDRRHVTIVVTDTAEEVRPVSEALLPHALPDEHGSPTEGEGTWPLKRSQSIDSRDNPFLPGGSLSKEADDILSKATIIRDTFILKDNASKGKNHDVTKDQLRSAQDVTSPAVEDTEHLSDSTGQAPVNESMIQQDVQKTETSFVQNASPSKTRTKENGQVDTENSLTPASVKVEIVDDDKEKKKQKKCCAIM